MNLFTILPIVAPAGSFPTISPSDIEYFVDYEVDSYDHWIFNKGGVANLTGLKQAKVLTAQATPTYSSNYLTISTLSSNALLTDLPNESSTQVDTVCAVVRLATVGAGIQVLLGSLGPTTDTPPLNGGGLFVDTGASYTTYRGVTSSASAGNSLSAGAWYFVAVSRTFSGSTKYVRTLIGGGSVVEQSSAGPYQPALAGRKIACGNAYYNSVITNTMDFAEFVVFQTAMTSSELLSLYTRRKSQMAVIGITVV